MSDVDKRVWREIQNEVARKPVDLRAGPSKVPVELGLDLSLFSNNLGSDAGGQSLMSSTSSPPPFSLVSATGDGRSR
jgi:hypothetical protein